MRPAGSKTRPTSVNSLVPTGWHQGRHDVSRAPDRVPIAPVELRSPLHERAKGRTLRLERDTRRVALATLDGRDKPEFARPERLYIDRAIPSIAGRLPQAPDRLSEAVLGHGRVSPGRLDERLSRDDETVHDNADGHDA